MRNLYTCLTLLIQLWAMKIGVKFLRSKMFVGILIFLVFGTGVN